MHRIAVRLSLALASAAALTLAGPWHPRAAGAQATTENSKVTIPLSTTQFVPCAAGGAGEFVALSGELQILMHVTINDNHLSAKFLSRPHLVGAGLTTGDTYRLVGPEMSGPSLQLDGATSVNFSVDNFRLVGQGPDNNLMIHQLFHVTVNNNGEVTSVQANTNIDCQ